MLESAAGDRGNSGLERAPACTCSRAGEVLLDVEEVVLPAFDDREQLRHRGDLFPLFLQEPVEELLTDELSFLARELYELDDLVGHAFLLLQRERDRRDDVCEPRLRCLDSGDDDRLVGIEQVLDDHHRVVPLLDRLAVEVRCELRERLGVVVRGDRDVLLRRRELVRHLTIQRVGEVGHLRDSSDPSRPEPRRGAYDRRRDDVRGAGARGTRLSAAGHRRRADNVAVVIADEHRDDPGLFGLYEGVPLPERGDWIGLPPDKITIYRVPLEESFADPAELRDEIRITVLHELGHYFGLDEDRIAELGYE